MIDNEDDNIDIYHANIDVNGHWKDAYSTMTRKQEKHKWDLL